MNNLHCVKTVPFQGPEPAFPDPVEKSTFIHTGARAHLWKTPGTANRQRNPSKKLWIWLLKSGALFRSSSTFRIEWITVEWCLPPKLRPISGSDACVSDLHRNMATWRGIATDLGLLRAFKS